MSADATLILGAFKTALATLYPTIPVKTSRMPASRGKPLAGGWTPGYPSTCLVITCSDPEEIDTAGCFETVSVRYRVLVEYLKPVQAAVTGAVDTGPTTVVEDPDVRDKRQAIRRALYKTFPGVANVFNVSIQEKPVYEQTGGGEAILLVTGAEFACTGWEARS